MIQLTPGRSKLTHKATPLSFVGADLGWGGNRSKLLVLTRMPDDAPELEVISRRSMMWEQPSTNPTANKRSFSSAHSKASLWKWVSLSRDDGG